MYSKDVKEKASRIKFVLTDCDGVLTDGMVFYGESGEVFKKFFIRDGMGVVRMRELKNIETGIVTGENSPSVVSRGAKLKINEIHLGVKEKVPCIQKILDRLGFDWSELAYIGDDINDYEVLKKAGLSAAPSDAFEEILEIVDYTCSKPGGGGAFRELSELIIRNTPNRQI